jgi:dihydropteroate synthase
VQITAFSTNKTLNAGGRIVDLSRPKVMAILNVTPDSFYDGGRYHDERSILAKTEQFAKEGATFIDIGGYSSRPGAADISAAEEMERVLPAIGLVATHFPELIISIDTFRSDVVRAAAGAGAAMINDISGGSLDQQMFSTAAALKMPYVLMHMKGTPQNMSRMALYDDVVSDVISHFKTKVAELAQAGVHDVVIDPGFGFAKTREHNFEILAKMELLGIIGKPLLAGLSRKSMVWKTLAIEPEHALNGTTVLNTIALMKGASILRVHDVKEAREVVELMAAFDSKQ